MWFTWFNYCLKLFMLNYLVPAVLLLPHQEHHRHTAQALCVLQYAWVKNCISLTILLGIEQKSARNCTNFMFL